MNKTRKQLTFFKKLLLVFLIIIISGVFSIAADVSIVYAQSSDLGGPIDSAFSGVGAVLGSVVTGGGKIAATPLLFTIGGILQTIGLFMLYFAGNLLDLAIPFSIDSENLLTTSVQLGWTIFRDLANMAFIFILLYIATMTILQASNFETKKLLAAVVIVALLVNFSFFLTGLVIDASNILALFIYSAITECPAGVTCTADGNIRPLSEVFMQGLKLASLDDRVSFSLTRIIDSSFEKGLNFFLQGVLYIVAASAFFAGAMIFVLRIIVLMFILMLSPIAFMALAIPGTKKYWSEWLHKLMGNAFVAPAYLLLIAVVISIIDSGTIVTTTGNLAGVSITEPNLNAFGIMLAYILVLGLIQGSLILSKRMAGDIATISVKWAGKLTGTAMGAGVAGGLALNAAALRTGLRSLGRGIATQTEKRTEKGSWQRRYGERASSTVSTLSGDIRTTRLGKAATKELKSATGVDVSSVYGDRGKARTEAEREKERTKKAVAKAEALAKETPTAEAQEKTQQLHGDLSDAKDRLVEARTTEARKVIEDEIKVIESNINRVQNINIRKGEKRKEEYTARLSRPRGFFAKFTGMAEADRKRAEAIRKKKSPGQKWFDLVKEETGEDKTKSEEESV